MSTKTVGKIIQLRQAIGAWPIGAIGKVIPAPYRTIQYDKVNSTGERVEFKSDPAIWIIMQNKEQIDAHVKFPVYENEIEEYVR